MAVRLIVLGAALVMIWPVIIGLAWVCNEYGATAFWVGIASVVLVVIWSERTRPLFRFYGGDHVARPKAGPR